MAAEAAVNTERNLNNLMLPFVSVCSWPNPAIQAVLLFADTYLLIINSRITRTGALP